MYAYVAGCSPQPPFSTSLTHNKDVVQVFIDQYAHGQEEDAICAESMRIIVKRVFRTLENGKIVIGTLKALESVAELVDWAMKVTHSLSLPLSIYLYNS